MLRQIIEPGFWMGFWVGAGLAIVIATMVVVVLLDRRFNRVHRLRVAGLYPAVGEPVTDHHYVALLRAGHVKCAARLYKKTQKVSGKEAAAAVERMAAALRSI
ncbi:MAG: hypothetical protein IPN65_07930 [Elusimicrobia bacterium]|jgi:hypothetical protein|nr:hypothetical protein [Elusimicrobiota bacterium]MBK7206683.1 hypothetical protein [Elusimicrobiota bacterium]MBK7545479.1 hypothetical protein [Elusimicrobiota bacterium]MBK7575331.1 hypothetical protein [Elusimicrobiota bacterium]MBK7687969.1 hypothetical protein [Elusimicrobiota bacterium]